jgi:hypothetical protein|nr:hypothetical protein [Formosa sp. Hel1_31_208]
MIKFFRKIRQNLLMENKTGKYFKYAIGEIVLVVIGILIALQVSNWNQLRVEQNTINTYYIKLISTLGNDIQEQKRNLDRLNSSENKFKRSLEILNSQSTADIEELKSSVGELNTAFVNDYSMELFDEFITKGYLSKIEDEELKSQFETVKILLVQGVTWSAVLDDEFISIIKPFIIKNLSYSDIPQGYKRLENERPKDGPEVDYTKLFNNNEAWNVIYGRLGSLGATIRMKNIMLEELQKLKAMLEEKINKS